LARLGTNTREKTLNPRTSKILAPGQCKILNKKPRPRVEKEKAPEAKSTIFIRKSVLTAVFKMVSGLHF
jgi:hypothetical protein